MKRLRAGVYIFDRYFGRVGHSDAGSSAQIEELLRIRHRIAPGAEDDFQVRNMAEIAEGAAEATKIMTILLGSIASISLLSAASAS